MEKKVPQRMCIACRTMQDKRNLLRVVRTPNGEIEIDETGKKNGRGAYICKNKNCIEKCKKGKQLSKTFKQNIDESVYQKIIEVIDATSR